MRLDQQKLPRSEPMARLTTNRNHQIHDYLMKSARYIVNYCIANEIGTVVVGYNPDWKRNINIIASRTTKISCKSHTGTRGLLANPLRVKLTQGDFLQESPPVLLLNSYWTPLGLAVKLVAV